jgi:hypothetical protein
VTEMKVICDMAQPRRSRLCPLFRAAPTRLFELNMSSNRPHSSGDPEAKPGKAQEGQADRRLAARGTGAGQGLHPSAHATPFRSGLDRLRGGALSVTGIDNGESDGQIGEEAELHAFGKHPRPGQMGAAQLPGVFVCA